MESHAHTVKVFAHEGATVPPKELIPVFHRFIQGRLLDETLIDVTDYSHVHHGPGVMLIAHEAHYALAQAGGRPGLLYARKRGGTGDLAARLEAALRAALTACRRLEEDASLAGRLRFAGDELLLGLDDRLLAPNDAATFAAWEQGARPVLARLHGDEPFTLEHLADPRACFRVRVRVGRPVRVADLLARLAPQ